MLKPCGHWPPSAWTGHFTFIGFTSSSSHIYSFITVTYSLLHVVYNKLYAPHWLFLLGVGGTDRIFVQNKKNPILRYNRIIILCYYMP